MQATKEARETKKRFDDTPLDRWIRKAGYDYRKLGRILGKSDHAVRNYAKGLRLPKADIMARLSTLSDGEITPNLLVDTYTARAKEREAWLESREKADNGGL